MENWKESAESRVSSSSSASKPSKWESARTKVVGRWMMRRERRERTQRKCDGEENGRRGRAMAVDNAIVEVPADLIVFANGGR